LIIRKKLTKSIRKVTFGPVQIERHEWVSTIDVPDVHSLARTIHILIIDNRGQRLAVQDQVFEESDRLGLEELLYVEPFVSAHVPFDIIVFDRLEALQTVYVLIDIGDEYSGKNDAERESEPEVRGFWRRWCVSGRLWVEMLGRRVLRSGLVVDFDLALLDQVFALNVQVQVGDDSLTLILAFIVKRRQKPAVDVVLKIRNSM
jgi:hypothetical protein